MTKKEMIEKIIGMEIETEYASVFGEYAEINGDKLILKPSFYNVTDAELLAIYFAMYERLENAYVKLLTNYVNLGEK